jgi:mono/diheme cytochrome c family protein
MSKWLACSIAIASIVIVLPLGAQMSSKSVWDGAYTEVQAKRGESVYAAQCSRCHSDDLTGQQSRLLGERFMRDWAEDNAGSLFRRIKATMPRGAVGSLSDAQYIDIVAYIFQQNGFPAGAGDLAADAAPGVMITGKDGPQPVPEFALVQLAGCLTQSGTNWVLTDTTEPFRTRAPELSPDDLKDPRGLARAGTGKFTLLDVQAYKPDTHKDHRVAVKGLLIRRPENRLNVTAISTISDACQ